MNIVIQVNGKVRANLSLARALEKKEILKKCSELDNVSKYLDGNDIIKEIYVPGKLVSFVVKGK